MCFEVKALQASGTKPLPPVALDPERAQRQRIGTAITRPPVGPCATVANTSAPCGVATTRARRVGPSRSRSPTSTTARGAPSRSSARKVSRTPSRAVSAVPSKTAIVWITEDGRVSHEPNWAQVAEYNQAWEAALAPLGKLFGEEHR